MNDSRIDSFHEGQVWESPRGTYYKVVSVSRGGQAALKVGKNGSGRKIYRDWDAVVGWVLHSDA